MGWGKVVEAGGIEPPSEHPPVERLRGLARLPSGRGLPATLPGWSEPLSRPRPPVPSGSGASLSGYAPDATETLSRRDTGALVVPGSPLTRRWPRSRCQLFCSPVPRNPAFGHARRNQVAPMSRIEGAGDSAPNIQIHSRHRPTRCPCTTGRRWPARRPSRRRGLCAGTPVYPVSGNPAINPGQDGDGDRWADCSLHPFYAAHGKMKPPTARASPCRAPPGRRPGHPPRGGSSAPGRGASGSDP